MSAAKLVIALLTLAPTILFAYFGHLMRMMRDDFGRVVVAREIGPIGMVTAQRDGWGGSFSDLFVQALLVSLDGAAAQIMPAIIIAIWLLGAIWLAMIGLQVMKQDSHRIIVSVVVASLMLAATINGLYSLESLYWYTASFRYTLPLALIALGGALVLHLARPGRSRRRAALAYGAAGVICFLTAGFAEMYLVFQLIALPFLALAVLVAADRTHRRLLLPAVGIGWLATILNGIVQVSAPGIGSRVEWYVGGGVTIPIRSLAQLIPVTVDLTFQYVTNQLVFAGFALLFAVGFFLSLKHSRSERQSSESQPLSLPANALWLALLAQICFVPILWTHVSDSPDVLNRFSYAFFVVICLNSCAILALLLLLLLRSRISAKMRRWPGFASVLCAAFWIATLAFFALTQFRSVHYKAAGYLFTSAMSVLGLLSCLLASARLRGDTRRDGALIAVCFAATIVAAFVLLALANYSIGYVRDRVMTPVGLLLVITGLVWGTTMGSWLGEFSPIGELKLKTVSTV